MVSGRNAHTRAAFPAAAQIAFSQRASNVRRCKAAGLMLCGTVSAEIGQVLLELSDGSLHVVKRCGPRAAQEVVEEANDLLGSEQLLPTQRLTSLWINYTGVHARAKFCAHDASSYKLEIHKEANVTYW